MDSDVNAELHDAYHMRHDWYNPRFYKPKEDNVIVADHVASFFDASTIE